MHYLHQVRTAYKEAIALHPTADSDLKQALRSNERVPKFIDNLAVEIEKVAAMRARKGKKNITDIHVKEIVYEMTDTFIKGLQGNAARRRESDIARIAREAEEAKMIAIEKASKGEMTGDFADMGLMEVKEDRST